MKNSIGLKFYAGFFAVIIAIGALYNFGTEETLTFEVDSKERVNGKDSSKYLIFTDNGVFENTDTIFRFKFDSSDIYGKLKIGETYQARVYGFRIGFLSFYPNIIEVRKINKGQDEAVNSTPD